MAFVKVRLNDGTVTTMSEVSFKEIFSKLGCTKLSDKKVESSSSSNLGTDKINGDETKK